MRNSRSPLLAVVFLAGMSSSCIVPEDLTCGTERTGLPIVLVHGVGGGLETWERQETFGALGTYGLLPAAAAEVVPRDADVFTFLASAEGRRDLDEWARELGEFVDAVRVSTGSPRVVLVAHSAGGLAARKHVVANPADHGVSALITISTPNRGTPLAKLSELKAEIEEGILPWPASDFGDAWIGPLTDLERTMQVRFDDPLFSQLLPEEENPWIQKLNESPHPEDVDFRFVTVESPDLTSLADRFERYLVERDEGFGDALFIELMNSLLVLLEEKPYAIGEGVVPAFRQAPAPLFSASGEGVRREDFEVVSADHSSVLGNGRRLMDFMVGGVSFLAANSWRDQDLTFISFDFQNELGGRSILSSRVGREDFPLSSIQDCRSSGRGFFRAVFGPIPEINADQLDFFVIPPDSQYVFGAGVPIGSRDLSYVPQFYSVPPAPPEIHVSEVAGIPSRKPGGPRWDVPLTGIALDLRVEIQVGAYPRSMSPEIPEVVGRVSVDWTETLRGDPLRDSLVIRAVDDDSGGPLEDPTMQNDLMGEVGWRPGSWPFGPTTAALSPSGEVTFELTWEATFQEVPMTSPLLMVPRRPPGWEERSRSGSQGR